MIVVFDWDGTLCDSIEHIVSAMQAAAGELEVEVSELRILNAHYPDIESDLAGQIVRFVQALRKEDLIKKPGIAETIDWNQALTQLDALALGLQRHARVEQVLGHGVDQQLAGR